MFIKLSVERKAENEALVEYLAEKCEEATQPLNTGYEIKKFIETRGSNTACSALASFLQKYKETVREITDEGKRARQLFCLSVKVDEELMKELEKHAHVILDANRKIVKYESHDGSIVLEGDQSLSSKIKNAMVKLRRSQMATMDNGGEEEDEDDEPEPPVPKKPRGPGSSQATSSTSSSLKPSASKQRPRVAGPSTRQATGPDNLPNRDPVNAPRSAPGPSNRRAPLQTVNDPRPSNTPAPAPQSNIQVKTEDFEEVKPVVQQQQTVIPVSAHKSFLELIQSLILTLKIPINLSVWKMEETIDKLSQLQILGRQMEEEVKIEDFHNIIISGVNIAKKNSSSTSGQEDLRSFKEFVLLLKMSVTHLRMKEMDELIGKLENIMEEPENLEKGIPVCKIEKALETVLEILL